jgi:biopolymer transport protein ExbD
MGMSAGGGSGIRSEINITPLVDVVLVLLIIFMVIQPVLQVGYEVNVPPKIDTPVPAPQSDDQVIVRIDAEGRYWINKEQIAQPAFPQRLRQAMTGRESKVAFFAADGDLTWERVATFLDICRDNGAQNLGIVFDDMRTAAP